MSLSEYFENTKGTGVLATADENGDVDAAIYARPHFQEEKTVAFIMNDRLSYQNITSNPKAAYLFLEDSAGYKGKRLYLTKVAEESDKDKIDCIRRKTEKHHTISSEEKHLVYFSIDRIRPLVGD
jgi:hypothetical protein